MLVIENPVTRIRRQLGIGSQLDLAVLCGVSVGTVTGVERGYVNKIPEVIMAGLEPFLPALGETPENVQGLYHTWRAGLSAVTRARADRIAGGLKIQTGLDLADEDVTNAVLEAETHRD